MDWKSTYTSEVKRASKLMIEFPWEDQQAYSNWLAQTYFFAVQTTPLLMLAGGKLADTDYDLHYRFIDHSKEEKGHPQLLINDLERLGQKIGNFSAQHSIESMYQSQFYWIYHRDPRAFFGYILFLEGIAAEIGSEAFNKAEAAHGKSATRFLVTHSIEDQDHIQEAFEQVAKFNNETLELVTTNLKHTAWCYNKMLIDSQTGTHDKKSAA